MGWRNHYKTYTLRDTDDDGGVEFEVYAVWDDNDDDPEGDAVFQHWMIVTGDADEIELADDAVSTEPTNQQVERACVEAGALEALPGQLEAWAIESALPGQLEAWAIESAKATCARQDRAVRLLMAEVGALKAAIPTAQARAELEYVRAVRRLEQEVMTLQTYQADVILAFSQMREDPHDR